MAVAVLVLAAAGCGDGEDRLSAEALARCGSRGSPVTIDHLVSTARANGTTLSIKESQCRKVDEGVGLGDDPIVTNGGYTGLESNKDLESREGMVLCNVFPSAKSRKIFQDKYPGYTETNIGVMNVDCALYPSDPTREAAQIARFRKTLEALQRQTPP